MKKIRLLMLVLMLVTSFSIFDGATTKTYGCADGGGCPQADRPNGCACCSDNHCDSGYCNPANDKCSARPGGGIEIILE